MHRRWLVVLALVVTGLSMRTAVSSVGAELVDVRRGLHLSGGAAGVLTTLPVLCFAAIGVASPPLARRFGPHRLLLVALALMTAGLVLRASTHSAGFFLLFSVGALSGGAVSNVLMPSLVKQHFPTRIGTMTAVYATAMAVGLTAGAGLSVPFGDAAGGWRFGLGCWAALSAMAVLSWLPLLRGRTSPTDAVLPLRRVAHSKTAWALTVFFGFQSFQAYIAFGWFATFLRDHGLSANLAGAVIAYFAALSIPASAVLPLLAARMNARLLLLALAACYLVFYVGLVIAPTNGVWVWMTFGGIASGGMFPLALALIGMRTGSAQETAALSAFVQSVGYLLAGTGPLLVGVLIGTPHHWADPFAALFGALAVMTVAGWMACGPVDVEAELALAPPTPVG